MSENEQPDWLAELARNSEALRRQIDEGGEAVRRQIELLSRSAEQFVSDAQRARARGASLPLPQRIALAVGELVRQPKRPVAHERTASLTVTPIMTVNAEVAAAAGIASSPAADVNDGDVITFSESASVELRDSRLSLAGLSAGQILALVLVWVAAYALPIYLYSQSPTRSTLIDADLATFALAYEITCRILDKRK